MNIFNKHTFASSLQGADHDILNVYQYGSRVYGTNTKDSDFDLIVIVNDCINEIQYSFEAYGYNIDVTLYHAETFLNQIKNHEISCLECLWLPEEMKAEKAIFNFKLELPKLREAVSAKCSNSFVKCKKKFIVEDSYDPYIGKKSLWHSIRMANFGKQIAVQGKIIDYSAVNDLYREIMAMPDDWDAIKEKYQPIYNAAMSEFRLVAPKG